MSTEEYEDLAISFYPCGTGCKKCALASKCDATGPYDCEAGAYLW